MSRTLGQVREEEDRRSWVALGRVPDRHEVLRYPDGGVADVPFDGLSDRIAAILRDERPDVVITFGPEGVTGHADHIAVGRATTEAFHRCRTAGGDGFRRLLYSSVSSSTIERFSADLVARGGEPIDSTQPFQPRGVPDETIGVEVDCSSVVDRKRAAFLEHRTQANDIPDDLGDEFFRYEPHVIAWWNASDPSAAFVREISTRIGLSGPSVVMNTAPWSSIGGLVSKRSSVNAVEPCSRSGRKGPADSR